MSPSRRLLVLAVTAAACLLRISPAHSGNFFEQTACDTTARDATTYSLVLVSLHGDQICEVEFRPKSLGSLPAAPITSWVVPPGWTAEMIQGEPGAIVLHGCVREDWYADGFKITMPGRAGNIQGWAYGPTGNWSHNQNLLFHCGANPTPAPPATWGRLKSLYR